MLLLRLEMVTDSHGVCLYIDDGQFSILLQKTTTEFYARIACITPENAIPIPVGLVHFFSLLLLVPFLVFFILSLLFLVPVVLILALVDFLVVFSIPLLLVMLVPVLILILPPIHLHLLLNPDHCQPIPRPIDTSPQPKQTILRRTHITPSLCQQLSLPLTPLPLD